VNYKFLRYSSDTHRFAILLGAFLLFILATPLFEDALAAGYIGDILFYSLLGAAAYSVRGSRFLKPALCIGAAALLGEITSYFTSRTILLGGSLGFSCIYLFLITILLGGSLGRQRQVSADTVMGGLCVYVLMGVFWGLLFVGLELAAPGSFSFGVHGRHPDLCVSFSLLYYYSFTTILTIGFGDVIPMSSMAQTLTILEGLIGRFYLVFYMAYLINLFIFHHHLRNFQSHQADRE